RDPHRMGDHFQSAVRLQLGALELQRPGGPGECLLEINVDSRVVITTGALTCARTAATSSLGERTGATGTEQRREKVAEALVLEHLLAGAVLAGLRASPGATPARAGATAKLEALGPIRRRTELLASLPVAAELIVGGALLRVFQDLVCLLDL